MKEHRYRPLTSEEITVLVAQGCESSDWLLVEVAEPFHPARVRHTHFAGPVRLGCFDGKVMTGPGVEKPAGLYDAVLVDCTVGDGVRVANIGSHVAHYDIDDGACIEDVGVLETTPVATFGNGVRVAVLNEGGGREVCLYDTLDAQVAYMTSLYRYRPVLVERLEAFAQAAAELVKSDRGRIGIAAHIRGVDRMRDVRVGDFARVEGAASLINGTILSTGEAPTCVGAGVIARDFIIAEATQVDGGAVLYQTFVGQGCRVGKQFSAEGSLFFANCEAFHGEACSVFAGPYTVTHHRSSLLIAGQFSFFNAGSGTNQSNHMYKLGPVHEGRIERGAKTGSFSYLMWPCRVGPFSVVLGKHTGTFDTSDFPFSHLDATPDGRSLMVPGFNLSTVGTARDGAKWPARDRRKGAQKRDRLSFDVFSPYTVGRMMRGSEKLKEKMDTTAHDVESVTIDGIQIKRVLLRAGLKYYRIGINLYLLEVVTQRLARALEQGTPPETALALGEGAVYSAAWVDVGGLLMPRARMDALIARVEDGEIENLEQLTQALDAAHQAYDRDVWAWVRVMFTEVFGLNLDAATPADLEKLADEYVEARTRFLQLILLDAIKEFNETVRTGFGQDGLGEEAVDDDFHAVRGTYEANAFVRRIQAEEDAAARRAGRIKALLSTTA